MSIKIFMALITLGISATSGAHSLKLLSWNIFMLPKPIYFSQQAYRNHQITAQLKATDYDVIFMQEAFITRARNFMAAELRQNFPYQEVLHRQARKPWHMFNSGLFIVSRHPMKVLDWEYYQRCTHADCFASKGVLLVELSLPGGKKIQLANTHMQANDDDTAVSVRKSQLAQIKNLLARHQKQDVPQLLVGDLNIDAKLPGEYAEALDYMQMSTLPLSGEIDYTAGYPVACYKVGPDEIKPTKWIDHFWLRPHHSVTQLRELRVRKFEASFGNQSCPLSDHLALEATLEL
jgi:endonuclease/exonuclease/phosphatase family metal-dependent hydrolase